MATVGLRLNDIRLEADREFKRYQAALRVVTDELEANIQTARLIVKENAPLPESPFFQHATYDGMQLILALHLTPAERLKVAKAYEPVRVPQALGRIVTTYTLEGETLHYFQPYGDNMKSALQKMEEAKALLEGHTGNPRPAESLISLTGYPIR